MRAAIIGCGAIAQVHAKAIAEAVGHELIATADILPERAEALLETYCKGHESANHVYTDWHKMLEQENIDVVHICAPHMLHAPMAKEAMEYGCHVFLEKPPALSFADWEALKKTSVSTGKRLAVCFQNRLNLSTQKALAILQSGELGAIRGIRGIVTWNRKKEYYTESPWRGKLETEGGSALLNQAVHTLDLVQYLGGETPFGVTAVMENLHLRDVIETEDTASIFMEYPDWTASFLVTTGYCEDAPILIDVVCEKGHLRLEGNTVTVRNDCGETQVFHLDSGPAPGKGYWGNGHVSAVAGFYDATTKGTPFLLDATETDASVRLMLGAYQSARSGERVSL